MLASKMHDNCVSLQTGYLLQLNIWEVQSR